MHNVTTVLLQWMFERLIMSALKNSPTVATKNSSEVRVLRVAFNIN